MRKFNYERADSYEEAARLLNDDGAVMAGGTDILGGIKHDIFAEVPKTLVSIKGIPGNDKIELDGDTIRIGAMATLADLVENEMIMEKAPIIAEAASVVTR